MNHLIVSREYPPCAYPQGGIGTYVAHIARLLAERGETVHVIGELWSGAPLAKEISCDGRLIVHRVPLWEPLPSTPGNDIARSRDVLNAMARSEYPMQAFSWQAALLAESLVETDGIDCIEGQDYEAPLYHFLLRRASGLGPRRRPPCFVHLHSPMQFICHFNDWEISRPDYLAMKRAEDYVIQASDAALCPSRYLARQVERHYGLAFESVARIPYPTGDTALIERSPDTWERGTICYFGRIEARKGMFEWIDAAVAVARERPGLRFEFIGADLWLTPGSHLTVREAIEARIPSDVRPSMAFLGARPRSELWARLREARFVVVPSRWENFPNTCVEAMSTGLPVLASPEGGMVEMVEDGRTGWIAASIRPDDLATALRRALDTPPGVTAEMGRAAAASIRQICNNAETVDRQVAFRRALVERGADTSLTVPRAHSSIAIALDGGPPLSVSPTRRAATSPSSSSPGLVAVSAVADLARVLDSPEPPLAVAIVDASCRLEPRFAEAILTVLQRNDAVGVVSSWAADSTANGAGIAVAAAPQRPYLWMQRDLGPCPAFRIEALRDVRWMLVNADGVSATDLALAVLLHGWRSATCPDVLSMRTAPPDALQDALMWTARSRIWSELRARFPDQVAWDAQEILGLEQSRLKPRERQPTSGEVLQMPLRSKVALARKALRDPAAAAAWALQQGRRVLGNTLRPNPGGGA